MNKKHLLPVKVKALSPLGVYSLRGEDNHIDYRVEVQAEVCPAHSVLAVGCGEWEIKHWMKTFHIVPGSFFSPWDPKAPGPLYTPQVWIHWIQTQVTTCPFPSRTQRTQPMSGMTLLTLKLRTPTPGARATFYIHLIFTETWEGGTFFSLFQMRKPRFTNHYIAIDRFHRYGG